MIVAEHAIERVIDGIAIDMRAVAQTGMAEKGLEAHAGVAGDGDGSNTSSRSRYHLKGDIGELLFGVGRYGLRDGRFVIAIFFEGGTHLSDGAKHFGLGETCSGFELGSALEKRIHGGPGGPIHTDCADKCARSSGKDQRHPVWLARALDFDIVIEARFVELAEAPLEVFGGERGAFGLRKMAGKRVEAVGQDSFEGDVQYRQAFPLENGGLRRDRSRGFERGGRGWSSFSGRRSVGRLLAPGGERRAKKNRRKESREKRFQRPAVLCAL